MALATLICIALMGGAGAQEPKTNLEKLELYNRVRSCTVKVYSEFGDARYHGTGVAFKRYNDFVMIVTNSHVVAMDGGVSPKVSVKPYSKTGASTMPAYVVFEHKADDLFFDLAFLVVRDPTFSISIAGKSTDPDWKKKPIYACGNPRTEEFLVDDGVVLPSSAAPARATKFSYVVLHDALTEHGNSGGGLFDSTGKLVGINTWLYDEKVSMAIELGKFNDLFDFRALQVFADSNHWVKDATLPAGSSVFALAIGKWKCDPSWDAIDPGGYSGSSEKCIDPDFNYGSALMRLGDKTACFNRTHWGPNKSMVIYSDARTAQIKVSGGDLSFRMNDKEPADNYGQVYVFYLIMFPVSALALRS